MRPAARWREYGASGRVGRERTPQRRDLEVWKAGAVLHLRVFDGEATIAQAARELEALAGCQHVIRTDDGASGQSLVTADLGTDAADAALTRVRGLGVPAEGRPAAAAGVDRAGPQGPGASRASCGPTCSARPAPPRARSP